MKDYQSVADTVAQEIRAGILRPGDRLPPQRKFAQQHGIANSTATRVYQELARRGLTLGEVGRGTFVRAVPCASAPALTEPAGSRIDLELNYPVVSEQAALLANGLGALMRPDVLGYALRPSARPAFRPSASPPPICSRVAAGAPTRRRCSSRGTGGRPSRPSSPPWYHRALGSASRN